MQLNDIVENNSIKELSLKTNIATENLEKLIEKEFDKLPKLKTMGFISIIQREYKADLSTLKKEANEYYNKHSQNTGYSVIEEVDDDGEGKSKLLIFIVLVIFGYASWYFFNQFDKKHLSTLIPFINMQDINSSNTKTPNDELEKKKTHPIEILTIKNAIEEPTPIKKEEVVKEVVVEQVIPVEEKIDEAVVQNITVVNEPIKEDTKEIEKNTTNSTPNKEETKTEEVKKEVKEVVVEIKKPLTIKIVPAKRLWFGIIDIKTRKKDQFSASKPFIFDLSKEWLVATSSATFYMIEGEKKVKYRGKGQHFKVTKDGITVLTKKEYVKLGGSKLW